MCISRGWEGVGRLGLEDWRVVRSWTRHADGWMSLLGSRCRNLHSCSNIKEKPGYKDIYEIACTLS